MDEKLFTIEQAHNHHNDRSWCAEAPGTLDIAEHCQNSKCVMVWAGIYATGKTPSFSFGKDLPKRLLPWRFLQQWTLQQDSAAALRVKATKEWCTAHFSSFTPTEWPPYPEWPHR